VTKGAEHSTGMEVVEIFGQRTALALGQTLSGNVESFVLGAGVAIAADFAVAPESGDR
jgi:hypothetical protein